MSLLLLASLWIAQAPVPDVPDADQFLRLMGGLQDEIRDITLVFEGSAGLIKGGAMSSDGTFQGLYSFRSDGATLMDVFSKSLGQDAPNMRKIQIILNGEYEGVSHLPDLGQPQPERRKARPGVLNGSLSAERILYYWYFKTLDDLKSLEYQGEGWEEVDSRRCLKVKINQIPRSGANAGPMPFIRFWIDMERGGHPLKVEFSDGKDLVMRTTVELRRFPIDGGESIWLPGGGQTDSFGYWGKDVKIDRSSTPLYREIYQVVDGSVRVNQSLNDSYFSLKKNRTLPDIGGLR
jgi:hypothetical protein